MTFDFLIEQNNRTLASLKAQDFVGAVESALFALKYLREAEVNNTSAEDSAGSCYKTGDKDWLDQSMLLSEIKEGTHHTAARVFVYEHGIFLHPSMSDSSIVAPILIFNTALAHHLAFQAGRASIKALHKAKKLYELAYRTQDIDNNILFQFVVINNIAMIDRQLGYFATANDCLDYLMSVLMVMVDRGCTMRLRHVQGFLKNIPSTLETAAAA